MCSFQGKINKIKIIKNIIFNKTMYIFTYFHYKKFWINYDSKMSEKFKLNIHRRYNSTNGGTNYVI